MVSNLKKLLLATALVCPTWAIAAPINVAVSIVPEQYFVEQIGKEHVKVDVIVSPGAEPDTYAPKARQMRDLAKTDIYFPMGVPFENAWQSRIADVNADMKVIPLYERICRRQFPEGMEEHHHGDEHHDHAEHHKHEGHDNPCRPERADPHIWMSPNLVRIMAGTIRDSLIAQDPAHTADYEKNFREFAQHINEIDTKILKAVEGLKSNTFLVYHPAFGYFARSYGLQQLPVQVHGTDPTPTQLAKIIKQAKASGIKVVFVEPQFSKRAAQTVAKEIGGQVVAVDPLAKDWGNNLVNVANAFTQALK